MKLPGLRLLSLSTAAFVASAQAPQPRPPAPPLLPPVDYQLGTAARSADSKPPASRKIDYKLQIALLPSAQYRPVPYELFHGVLLFQARLDGQDVWAMLDNGSGTTVIDAAFLRSRGFALGSPLDKVRTPTGSIDRWRAPDVPIEVPGEMTISGAAFAADLSSIAKLSGRPISVVLGKELFDNLVLLVRPAQRNFVLAPSGSFTPSADARTVELKGDKPQLTATIDGQSLLLALDLGDAAKVTLGKSAWASLGLDDKATLQGRSANVDAKLYSTKETYVDRVKLGPVLVEHVLVTQAPELPEDGDGRLGLGFLSQFTFAIDVKKRTLWLMPKPGG